MNRMSNAVLQITDGLYENANKFLKPSNDVFVNSTILKEGRLKNLADYVIRPKNTQRETNDFLSIIASVEKQEKYSLNSDEFNELLQKVTLEDREKLSSIKLFARVDDFVIRAKAKTYGSLRKRHEGIRKNAEEEFPKRLEPEILMQQKRQPWVPSPEKGEVYPNIIVESITNELKRLYNLQDKQENIQREAKLSTEKIDKKIKELQQQKKELKAPYSKKEEKLQEQLATFLEDFKLLVTETLPMNAIQKWNGLLLAHLEHYQQKTAGQISKEELKAQLITQFGDKMDRAIQTAEDEIIHQSRTVADAIVLYPETEKRRGYAGIKIAGVWDTIISGIKSVLEGIKNYFSFWQTADDEMTEIDAQLSEYDVGEDMGEEIPVEAKLDKKAMDDLGDFIEKEKSEGKTLEQIADSISKLYDFHMEDALEIVGEHFEVEAKLNKDSNIVKKDIEFFKSKKSRKQLSDKTVKSRTRPNHMERNKTNKSHGTNLTQKSRLEKYSTVETWMQAIREAVQGMIGKQSIEKMQEWIKNVAEQAQARGFEWIEALRNWISQIQPPEYAEQLGAVIAKIDMDFVKKAGGGYPNDVDKCRYCLWFNTDTTLDGHSGFFGKCATCMHAYTEKELDELKDEDKAEVKDYFQDRATATNQVHIPGYESKKANLKKKAMDNNDFEIGDYVEADNGSRGTIVRIYPKTRLATMLLESGLYIEGVSFDELTKINSREASLKKKAEEGKEVFTIQAYNIIAEDDVTDMPHLILYYSLDEARDEAQDYIQTFADEEDEINVTVFGGEYEQESGDVLGEPTDLATFSNKPRAESKRKEVGFVSDESVIFIDEIGKQASLKKKSCPRRIDGPRTDKERLQRHKKLYPEDKVETEKDLPPRGTGLALSNKQKQLNKKAEEDGMSIKERLDNMSVEELKQLVNDYIVGKTNIWLSGVALVDYLDTREDYMQSESSKQKQLNKIAKDKDDLEQGTDIEMEHKPTFKKIKKDVKKDKKLDMKDKDMAKSITRDHLNEEEDYYDDKKGLPEMEKRLSNKNDGLNKKADGGGTHPLYDAVLPSGDKVEVTPGEQALKPLRDPDTGKIIEVVRYEPKSIKDKALGSGDKDGMKFEKIEDERTELDKLKDMEGVEYKEEKDKKKKGKKLNG